MDRGDPLGVRPMVANASPALATLRVDHVGSLLRPDSLKAVIEQFAQGQATAEDLRAAQDAAIRDVIARQEAIGLPIVTDGEFRRINFQDSFADSVAGYGTGTLINRVPVSARLRLVRNQPLEEFRFSRAVAQRPVKMTLVSADRVTQRFDWE